jgi:hypothetical protein
VYATTPPNLLMDVIAYLGMGDVEHYQHILQTKHLEPYPFEEYMKSLKLPIVVHLEKPLNADGY